MKIFTLLLAICMPIMFFLFLRVTLKIWSKNRDVDFKEYSYTKDDMLKRTKFIFKFFLIMLFPGLLIDLVNVFNFIHLLNCFDKLEYDIFQIIISIIIALVLLVIQWICYKRIVKYDYYLSVCKKYNVVNEKLELEILTIIEMLYFNFSVVIFLIDII